MSVVISANFASRKIAPCIYLGDANGSAPLKGPFEAEIVRLPVASPRQPFASSAALLFALGYGPMPEGKTKIPCFVANSPRAPWTSYYQREPRTPDDIREMIADFPNACLGVVCGYRNLLCIDIDTDDQDIINAILHALPTWTVAKRGSKGLTIFFRYRGDPDDVCNLIFCLKNADGKKGDVFCEILWHGRKTTTPPTMHAKTGSPYTWVKSEHKLFNMPVDKLPEITEVDLEALEAAIKPWAWEPPLAPEETGKILPRNYNPTDLEAKRFRAVGQIILDRLTNELKGMSGNGRNLALYCASRQIGKYVHHKHLDENRVIDAFSIACNHNGLDKDDGGKRGVLATIRSGLKKSINDPLRELRDRPRPQQSSHAPRPGNSGDPLPLARPLDPAPEYPLDALGDVLGMAAKAMYREIVQAPLPVCCNAVLSAAALALQGHVDVELPHGGVKPISLYLLSILETGGRKSATDEHALKAISDYERELRELYDEKYALYQNRLDAWKSEREKIKRKKNLTFQGKEFELNALGREPVPPPFPLVRYTEPSIEGLIQALRYGHPSAGLFTSEGGQFIGGHAMSDDAKMRSTTTLNRFWDGAPADRIRAAEKFLLVGRRISIHLQAQPDVATAMMCDRALQDNGFLSRFLISAPESLAGTRFAKSVSLSSRIALDEFTRAVMDHLRRELPYVQGKNCFELSPRVLRFSEEATALWWQFHDEVEAELKPEGRLAPVAGLGNKLPEHAARIAAVLAAFENKQHGTVKTIFEADEVIPEPKPIEVMIDVLELERGIQIARYYADEALRIAAAAKINVELMDAKKLLDWLHAKWTEAFVAIAPLVEFGPSALRDTAIMKRLVATLVEYGWLIPAEAGTVVHNRPRKEAWLLVRPSGTAE